MIICAAEKNNHKQNLTKFNSNILNRKICLVLFMSGVSVCCYVTLCVTLDRLRFKLLVTQNSDLVISPAF